MMTADAPFRTGAVIAQGLLHRVEQIAAAAGEKFPLFSIGKTDAWVLSRSGSWMAGFWCALQLALAKHTISRPANNAHQREFVHLEARLEALLEVDSIHIAMVFWYGSGADYWHTHSVLPPLARRAAFKLAAGFNAELGFIPLGQDFAAGPRGATTFSVDALAALIKLLAYARDSQLRLVARQHTDFYIAHCMTPDGACCPSWRADSRAPVAAGDWSRGQAWAIYGLVTAANCWPDDHYAAAARRALHYWLISRADRLAPDLLSQPAAALDPSASVIVALAMYEFADAQPNAANWSLQADRLLDAVLASPFIGVIPGNSACKAYRFYGCAIPASDKNTVMAETTWGYHLLLQALQWRCNKHPEYISQTIT